MKTIKDYMEKYFDDIVTGFTLIICGILILLFLGTIDCKAQSFKREGKVLVATTKAKVTVKDTLQTDLLYEVKGVRYPIIVNKKSGRCYIWRARRTNGYYPWYLPKYAAQAVCREYNITYVEK